MSFAQISNAKAAVSFAQLLAHATASEASRPDTGAPGTEFVYDENRYSLGHVHEILEVECFLDLSDKERIVDLDHRDLMDQGVNIRALAQRIDEAGDDNTLDIMDVFEFVNDLGDIDWLNARLRSTMPTDVLATALGTGADSLAKFFDQFGGLANEHGEPILVSYVPGPVKPDPRIFALAEARFGQNNQDGEDEGFVHDAEA
jgi:hypothetical protein